MTSGTRLCFIDAGHVEATAQDLSSFDVITAAGKRLGKFVGLIVDPPVRRIVYLVVKLGLFGHRRVLVPMSLARLDVDHRAVEVDLANDEPCPAFDPQKYPPLSDEDTLAALFGRSDRM